MFDVIYYYLSVLVYLFPGWVCKVLTVNSLAESLIFIILIKLPVQAAIETG